MEEASYLLVIPGWIWVIVAMFVIGVIVVLVLKGDRRSSRRHRSRHSSRRHRHRDGRHSD